MEEPGKEECWRAGKGDISSGGSLSGKYTACYVSTAGSCVGESFGEDNITNEEWDKHSPCWYNLGLLQIMYSVAMMVEVAHTHPCQIYPECLVSLQDTEARRPLMDIYAQELYCCIYPKDGRKKCLLPGGLTHSLQERLADSWFEPILKRKS